MMGLVRVAFLLLSPWFVKLSLPLPFPEAFCAILFFSAVLVPSFFFSDFGDFAAEGRSSSREQLSLTLLRSRSNCRRTLFSRTLFFRQDFSSRLLFRKTIFSRDPSLPDAFILVLAYFPTGELSSSLFPEEVFFPRSIAHYYQEGLPCNTFLSRAPFSRPDPFFSLSPSVLTQILSVPN